MACYQVGDLGHEQPLVLTGQEVVLGSLQASGGVQPVVADDVGVELRGRVLPLELVLVVHRDGACDRLTAGHGDRTPLPLEPCGDLAGVAGLVPQGVGVLGLQPVGVDQQRGEQHQTRDGDLADGCVHVVFTTCVGLSATAVGSNSGAAGVADAGRR